jgi:DNA (cytosine-5)-methyltransferase 1
MSGFTVRGLVERDKYCCETLQNNSSRHFQSAQIIQKDIQRLFVPRFLELTGLSRSRIDLISGGPPCQSFSVCGIPKGGRSPRDPRDALLSHFVRFVRRIRPAVFLFENVPGLMSKSNGRIFNAFLKSFSRIGYSTTYRVLNAADYGVPQSRRRLFVLGSVPDLGELDFPPATHGPGGMNHGLIPYVTIRDSLSPLSSSLPNQRVPRNTRLKAKMMRGIRPGSEWKHWRHRDRWNGLSRCLTAHCRDEWIHPVEARAGTVRELASLQTFPVDYVFCGPFNAPNNSELSFQYRQVGNSVPVLLAKAIGESLISHLSGGHRGITPPQEQGNRQRVA